MGTEIGVKGLDLDADALERIGALRRLLRSDGSGAEIVVDGGIRRHVVELLAQAGADGVVPGSLVFADPEPKAAVRWLQSL
jgi:ribulose-phosphate 3-epimerase